MARIRSIKPEFCTSQSVGRLSRPARLFFLELLTEADDEGRFIDAPKRLAGDLFPWDDDVGPSDVEGWLDELVAEAIVVRYATQDGHFGAFVNWSSHQKVQHPTASRLPAPPSRNSHETLTTTSGDGHEDVYSDFHSQAESPVEAAATKPVDNPQPMSETPAELPSRKAREGLTKVSRLEVGIGYLDLELPPLTPPSSNGPDDGLARSAPPEASPKRATTETQLRPAVLAACRLAGGSLTPSALKSVNLAVAELRSAGAQPGDVADRAARYRARWPDVVLTPKALAKHWATLAVDAQPTSGREYPPLRVVDYPPPAPEVFSAGVESCRAALAKGDER